MWRHLCLLFGLLALAGAAASAGASGALPLSPTALGVTAAHEGLQVEPARITYTGDGTGFLGGADVRDQSSGIDWTRWTAATSLGKGYNQLNNCVPSCAGGRYTAYAVNIEMWRPRVLHGTLVFTRMTIFYEHSRPRGALRHYTFTDTYRSDGFSGYGWGPPGEEGYCVHTYGQPPEPSCKNIHTLP